MLNEELIAQLTKDRDAARLAAEMHLQTVETQAKIIAGQSSDLAELRDEGWITTDIAAPVLIKKLLSIVGNAYQIAGAHDVPEHILDVLSDPEEATEAQIEAMLPYVVAPSAQQAAGSIDTGELRRLAEAATPGPWVQSNKRVPYVKALGEDSHLLHTMPIGDDAKDYHPDTRARWLRDAAYIAAANPAAILLLPEGWFGFRSHRGRFDWNPPLHLFWRVADRRLLGRKRKRLVAFTPGPVSTYRSPYWRPSMSTYRKEWPCCDSVTETSAWEPEACPFCTPAQAEPSGALPELPPHPEKYFTWSIPERMAIVAYAKQAIEARGGGVDDGADPEHGLSWHAGRSDPFGYIVRAICRSEKHVSIFRQRVFTSAHDQAQCYKQWMEQHAARLTPFNGIWWEVSKHTVYEGWQAGAVDGEAG